MRETAPIELAQAGVTLPPSADRLPCDDGIPMETHRHVLQMRLLMEPLEDFWAGREFFVGGNMFVYFSPEQVRKHDYRGPDVFVVLDVERRNRQAWVVWEEGKGPDVVIELLSESTAAFDKTEKKRIYQDRLRVPEYFWFDPFGAELAGFALNDAVYEPMEADERGNLVSRRLGLALARWHGEYGGAQAEWLRWASMEGDLVPTPQERARAEALRAVEASQRAVEASQRAVEASQYAETERLRAEDAERRAAHERERAERFAEMLRALGKDPDQS